MEKYPRSLLLIITSPEFSKAYSAISVIPGEEGGGVGAVAGIQGARRQRKRPWREGVGLARKL